VIVGTARSDVICVQGGGQHIVYGGLLDDEIYGGSGQDLLIGGHGTDLLHGREGNDVLRGGTGRDCYVGGVGDDTVSFAGLTPEGGIVNQGVVADLTDHTGDQLEPGPTCEGFDGQGTAFGEGYNEELVGIENLVGSAFDDELRATYNHENELYGGWGDDTIRGYGPGDDLLHGEDGNDICFVDESPVPCEDAPENGHRPSGSFAFAEHRGIDRGVVVMGAEGMDPDRLTVTTNTGLDQVVVTGEPLTPTAACPATAPDTLTCSVTRARYVVVWGGLDVDKLTLGDGFAKEASLDLNGGPGDDWVEGGSGPEVLFSGEGGFDLLLGNGGTDALISEGDPIGTGGDNLDGGPGVDQLVTDNACAGHFFQGGSDTGQGAWGDIIGFARQRDVGLWAKLGEEIDGQAVHGDAYMLPEPPGCVRSAIAPGGEVLEGTNQADQLRGNGAPNLIWGRDGIDSIFGFEGDDILHGHGLGDLVYGNAGDDVVWGEGGADELRGGGGSDKLRALDNVEDAVVNCGGDPDYAAQADPNDPVVGCGEL
jgi:Ca2+-binding RTX toxin-like protein